jgi:valyl-tRNA synthetase
MAVTTKLAYDPKSVEDKWTKQWHDNGVFDLDVNPDSPSFSIAIPPPNITGNLHMGHALNGTLQDILIRWKRMQGYNVLWQPGTDHAGISTQMVVERQLKKEGKNRHQIGREQFTERVWEWRNQYGNQILNQYKRLGVSFAWNRVAFTMDPDYVKAIMRAFVILFREGYIYRGNRITNWCPRCATSLSDLEVEHEETKGHLYLIKYRLDGGADDGLVVATTRPETMFGDVAVAVHPEDKRYSKYIGKNVLIPLSGRSIPVIADDYVDREFGTGALKITPAHDANDWEVGRRHDLPLPVVIDQDGKLIANEFVPDFLHNKERFAARKEIVEQLPEQGLLVEDQDYIHGVGHCERCHTVIEPLLSDQWYVRMKELAEPAIKVVEEERIVFIPERYASSYLDWMRNIRDWCISRQLWWGHRIPVWTCANGHQGAFEETPAACEECGSKDLEQDPDVLDTWFSSALWPFATLGWPNETREMKIFYPTTVLSTAREIINLWVARMIFTSLKFVGKIPFKHVLIHPVIQTPDGKRMSKSKGNAVDPLDMIDKYGADANRFWFASVGVKGDQDVRFREDKLEEYKRFANKLWNAGRFTLEQLEGFEAAVIERNKLTLADRWILDRFNRLLQDAHEGLRSYDFDDVSRKLHEFIWDYYCDWYLEIAKVQLSRGDAGDQTKRVLQNVFEGLMRVLHPIMPFITEDLWQRTPKSPVFKELETIMFAPFPRADESYFDESAERDMSLLMKVIRSIRNIRQTFEVPASSEAEVLVQVSDERELACLKAGEDYIRRLARVNPITISSDAKAPGMAAWEMVSAAKVYVPLGNLIDVEKSREKIERRRDAIQKDIDKLNQTLGNKDFIAKAPPEKVQDLQNKMAELQAAMQSVLAQLKILDQ